MPCRRHSLYYDTLTDPIPRGWALRRMAVAYNAARSIRSRDRRGPTSPSNPSPSRPAVGVLRSGRARACALLPANAAMPSTITDKLSTSSVPMTFPASWPRTLCFLGRLSAAIGEYDTAIDWLVQARSVSVRAHSTVLEASSLLRTATVYAELREHGRGAETLRRIAIPASRFEYLANRGSQRNRNDTRRFKGITRDRSHSSKMSSRSLAKKGPSHSRGRSDDRPWKSVPRSRLPSGRSTIGSTKHSSSSERPGWRSERPSHSTS